MARRENSGILDTAASLLEEYPLCDRCLGRQFAWLSTGTSNDQRGYSIKLILSMKADGIIKSGAKDEGRKLLAALAGNGLFAPAQTLAEKEELDYEKGKVCYLCAVDGECAFDRIPEIVQRAVKNTKDIEFHTFLAGSIPRPTLAEREDELKGQHNLIYGETLRSNFNREFGKQLAVAFDKTVDFDRPELVVVYDMQNDLVRLQINPLFVYGRYRKMVVGVPQSRWDCTECNGKGCDACHNTGRRYPDSISEYVSLPIQEAAKGTRFKFHGAGREDVDALMLGTGRPFVVEISEPRVRTLNLSKLEKRIRKKSRKKVEVEGLRPTNRQHLQQLKSESSENIKEYSAIIKTDQELTDDEVKRAERELTGVDIAQRTPTRVAHRRSDLTRTKHIYEVRLEKKGSLEIEGYFKVQGGTYIKELISGDEGRTVPSVADKVGSACLCTELIVTAIHNLETDHNP